MTETRATKVAIVTETDINIFQDCTELLNEFDLEVLINSNLDASKDAVEYVQNAESEGVGVIVAGYKKGSNFAESLAKVTNIPVIAVPIKQENDKGLDLLSSMLNGEESVPVATVAVNGIKNAALLAVQILSTSCRELREKMKNYKNDLKEMVEERDKLLRQQYEAK